MRLFNLLEIDGKYYKVYEMEEIDKGKYIDTDIEILVCKI